MKLWLPILFFISLLACGGGSDEEPKRLVTFLWEAPTHYTNGDVLYPEDLDFYQITCNEFVVAWVEGNRVSYQKLLPKGEYTCYIQAFSNNVEGLPSSKYTIYIE